MITPPATPPPAQHSQATSTQQTLGHIPVVIPPPPVYRRLPLVEAPRETMGHVSSAAVAVPTVAAVHASSNFAYHSRASNPVRYQPQLLEQQTQDTTMPARPPAQQRGWWYIPGPMLVAPAIDWDGRLIILWRTTSMESVARDDASTPTDYATQAGSVTFEGLNAANSRWWNNERGPLVGVVDPTYNGSTAVVIPRAFQPTTANPDEDDGEAVIEN
ncbi:hypothetical protein AURDEDRAFT_176524 [Auricularia subglabra TFB-10046 SS5]|uniref:Uncharacterized protein n=1 Tax=Auricularia subglabra (strain TFB-10046 / SS5) TaxID=717982 RepID=J0WR74_AURST|nr:hypothetical protein AURDEDRAFT_176524 [Auricularia subglabra TFB-10046 SS5]